MRVRVTMRLLNGTTKPLMGPWYRFRRFRGDVVAAVVVSVEFVPVADTINSSSTAIKWCRSMVLVPLCCEPASLRCVDRWMQAGRQACERGGGGGVRIKKGKLKRRKR